MRRRYGAVPLVEYGTHHIGCPVPLTEWKTRYIGFNAVRHLCLPRGSARAVFLIVQGGRTYHSGCRKWKEYSREKQMPVCPKPNKREGGGSLVARAWYDAASDT